MLCPICRIEMIAVERAEIELDHCISCRGLWFDRGEIELLAELSGADLSSLDGGHRTGGGSKRACPRCDARLEEIAVDTLRIDRCPGGHGLWFDRGELGAVISRALAAGGTLSAISTFLGEVFGADPLPGQPDRNQEDSTP
jgi:Zn-finger nucleic acid-binding protein